MKKEGLSHVEIILSFVIFVFSILIALSFIPPFGDSVAAEASAYSVRHSLLNALQIQVERQTIIVHPPIMNKSIAVNVLFVQGKTIHAENESGTILAVERVQDTVRFNWNASMGRVIYLYAGNFSVTPGVSQNVAINEALYSRGAFLRERIISEESMRVFKENYDRTYAPFKTALNLSQSVDFSFSLIFDDGSRIDAVRQIPADSQVYSQSTRVHVQRLNGARSFATLEVKVW